MRMIAIVDGTPKVEIHLLRIEEIPEGTDPDDAFDTYIQESGYKDDESGQLGYMFIHPVFGALVQAAEVPTSGGDSVAYALNEYKMTLCKMIEVAPEFEISADECRYRFEELKNRWVATAASTDKDRT